MSYRLEVNEPLAAGIKRIATEQIDSALAQLNDAPEGHDEAVHDARKRFKKIRAVLRLVRDEIGEEVYKRENICYRDAGRQLSEVRDSAVMVETLDDLTEHFAAQLAPAAFAAGRAKLVLAHQSFKRYILDDQDVLAEVAETIRDARPRIANLPIEHHDFSALRGGLRRVYKRGRNRLADAYDEPLSENFHEWRKRIKYLWYHTRILRPIWRNIFAELADELHDLSDYIGDDHDLAELRGVVQQQPEIFSDDEEIALLTALIDERRAELETAARPLGERIYAEKPDDFVARVAAYWEIWQRENVQRSA